MKDELSSPLISILMPVFNAGPFLNACLQSIAHQSLQNWELIAVDDYSTDNGRNILNNFSLEMKSQNINVKVLQNTSKGIIPALELAYLNSSGEFITRMDADDIMPPSKLHDLSQKLNEHPNAVITGKVEYFSDEKLANGFLRYADWLNGLIDAKNHWQAIYKECVIPSPCWMIKRETLDAIGGICIDRYPEDYDLCFRMYEHQLPVIGINKILHLWRDHGQRASRKDPNYMDQHFLELKLFYFLKLDFRKDRELLLLGAGKTGKIWAKALIKMGVSFRWLTGNPKKIGHNIFGVILENDKYLRQAKSAQIICAIKEKGFVENHSELLQNLRSTNDVFLMY